MRKIFLLTVVFFIGTACTKFIQAEEVAPKFEYCGCGSGNSYTLDSGSEILFSGTSIEHPRVYKQGHFCIDIISDKGDKLVSNNCIKINNRKIWVDFPIFDSLRECHNQTGEIRETAYMTARVIGSNNYITARLTENSFDMTFNKEKGYMVTEYSPLFILPDDIIKLNKL